MMITVPTLIVVGVKNTASGVWLSPLRMTRIRALTVSSGFAGGFAAADDESDHATGTMATNARAAVAPKMAKRARTLRGRLRPGFISIESTIYPARIVAAVSPSPGAPSLRGGP